MLKELAMKAWTKAVAYVKARLTEKTTAVAILALLANHFAVDVQQLAGVEPLIVDILAGLAAALPTPKLAKSDGQANLPVGAVAVAFLLLLTGCGPNFSVLGGYLAQVQDPQNQAGLVIVEYRFCENSLGGRDICGASMVDGKEQAKVDLDWEVDQEGKMSITYSATDSRAFQAFATRAELQKALGESLGANVFDALQGVINPVSATTP